MSCPVLLDPAAELAGAGAVFCDTCGGKLQEERMTLTGFAAIHKESTNNAHFGCGTRGDIPINNPQ